MIRTAGWMLVGFAICYATGWCIWGLAAWWGSPLWLAFLLATASNVAIGAEFWSRRPSQKRRSAWPERR